ncbi:MAG TPA: nucleotide exchange factor GrpE [Patescibacteria group bacterium]|nr:nucleotide exchange factor GrpE [Patescibacteria group bacterium]
MGHKTKEPLQGEVRHLEEKVAVLEQQLKRALADYANLERRVEGQKQEIVEYANFRLLERLLPIVDDLERAVAHTKDEGTHLILKRIHTLLSTVGVEEIQCVGLEFNPEEAECIEVIQGENNKTLEIIEKGYRYHKKVLRPAKVKVGGNTSQNEVTK